MLTVSPSCLSISWRSSASIGSLCLPSPSGMKELRKGLPSTVPATLTRPRVPKNSALQSVTTYVQPPLAGLLFRAAVKVLPKAPCVVMTISFLLHQGYPYIREPGVVRVCPVSSQVFRPDKIIGQPPYTSDGALSLS